MCSWYRMFKNQIMLDFFLQIQYLFSPLSRCKKENNYHVCIEFHCHVEQAKKECLDNTSWDPSLGARQPSGILPRLIVGRGRCLHWRRRFRLLGHLVAARSPRLRVRVSHLLLLFSLLSTLALSSHSPLLGFLEVVLVKGAL